MIEFKHRTDLLNAARICWNYRLSDLEFKRLRRDGFPEPTHFCMVTAPGKFCAPAKVVFWLPSIVEEHMGGRQS